MLKADPLRVEASLAHGGTAIAAVVAELPVAGAARRQVITVVALAAQVHLSGSIRLSQSAYHGVYHVVVPFGPGARTAYRPISDAHWIFIYDFFLTAVKKFLGHNNQLFKRVYGKSIQTPYVSFSPSNNNLWRYHWTFNPVCNLLI
jgi:hypothetical protein